jgi:hypothetical protein
VGVQVLDQGGAGGARRDRPGVCVAVRVAGIVQDVAEAALGASTNMAGFTAINC